MFSSVVGVKRPIATDAPLYTVRLKSYFLVHMKTRTNSHYLILTGTIAALVGSTALHAQTAWDGGASTTDYATALNWAGDIIPGNGNANGALIGNSSNQTVVYNTATSYTSTGTAAANSLIVGSGTAGVGSLTLSGSAGTLTFGGDPYGSAAQIGSSTGTAATGTVTVTAGKLAIGTGAGSDASINLGVFVGGSGIKNGTLLINGGTVEVGRRILMGANATTAVGLLTISSGTLDMKRTGSNAEGDLGMVRFGTGTNTVNLDGGTAILTGFHISGATNARSIIYFNGTTLRANAANADFFLGTTANANLQIKNNGLIFDTNTFAVTINDALSDFSGHNGLLTKQGAGTLTLSSGASSYTGNISITGGTLLATGTTGGLNPTTSALGNPRTASRTITVGSGAILSFGNNDILGNAGSTVVAKLIVNGGTVNNSGNFFTTLGAVDLNAGTINSVGGAAAAFPSFQLGGQITVGGSAASTISGSGTNSQMLLGIAYGASTSTTFNVADATSSSASDLNVSVVLQNSGGTNGLTKTGVGTMTLSGANTYTGSTLVNAGTLVVNGGTIAGPGLIDIGSVGNAANFTLTTGSVTAGTQFVIGAHGSTGTAAIDGGALQVNGVLYLGGYGEGTGTGTITQTAGTVTSTAGVNFGGGGPNSGIYNLNGSTLTTTAITKAGSGTATFNFNGGTLRPSAASAAFMQGLTAANVQSGGALINTNGFDITIAQPLLDGGGGGGLTKSGAGKLTLPGAHTFTGAIAVQTGTLALSAGTYAGGMTLANNTRLSSATNLIGALTVPTLALGTGTTLDFHFGVGNSSITISNAAGLTLGSSAINLFQDGGTVAYSNAGIYTIFDYNTSFNGDVNTFSVANPVPGRSYAFTDEPTGTTIQLTITNLASQWIATGGGLWTDSANWNASGVPNFAGATAEFGASITGSATITMNGPKTVGAIVFGNATHSYTVSGTAPDTLTLDSGTASPASISVLGVHTIATPVVLDDAATITASAASSLTISGDISGAQALTTGGAGTVVLTGTNSYSGGTTITSGTLELGAGSTTGSIVGDVVDNGILIFNRSDDLTFSGAVSGSGSVVKNGANILTLSGTNGYTAGTTVNSGTLVAATDANLGSGTITLNGGNLRATGNITRAVAVGASGGTLTVDTGVTFSTAALTGTATTLTKAGPGTLAITAGAGFGSTLNVNGGLVAFSGGGSLAASTAVAVASGATVRFSRNDTFGNHATAVSQTFTLNGGTIDNGGTFTTLGAVTLNAGTINSIGGVNASFPSFSLRGPITVGGSAASTISGSGVNSQMVVGVNTAGSQTTFNVADATGDSVSDLNVTVPLQNNRNAGFAEVATGIIKDGAGTMTLAGVNTFTGPTSVNAGTLLVSGSISGSTTTVNIGGTLGGSGGSVGALVLNGGTLAPGASPGVLNSGSATLSSGTFAIEINGTTLGSQYDQLSVTGTVNLSGATLSLSGSYLTTPVVTNDLFTILLNDSGDAITGTFAGLSEGAHAYSGFGQDYTISYVGGDGNDIVLTAVPEPGSAVMLVGGLATLLGFRRRRN